ncbi:MAG: ABC transporter ATP-binding protein [Treponema sp.]|jgi:ABC-2 type transport system ATP-binding protein|nr:ABC transporter ATP-binding protein [Treponema sp.]
MVRFQNITKNYGKNTALRDFSITIDRPGIYCLLGRNGAGKTTLLKTLAGHIAATSGTVTVNGKAVDMLAMPEEVYFVETGAAQFNIRLTSLFNAAANINPDFERDFALELGRRFHLDLKKRYKQLSFGMKAMVNTLIALSSGREILVLDEPVLGFDPVMRMVFYELLQECCAAKLRIVIVSTHIIDEIAKAAEQLIIVDKGQLKLYCGMDEVDEKAYSVTGPAEHVRAATEGLHVIGEIKAGGFISRYVYDQRIDAGDRCSVSSLGLQDFFIGLVGGDREAM